jgi:hypothetical protein
MTLLHWDWSKLTATLGFCFVFAYFAHQKLRPSLRSIPGPFVASFTDLWRLLAVYSGRFDLSLQAQHDKHGDLVRIGPNCISVGDPKEIKQIYSISRLFQKVSPDDAPGPHFMTRNYTVGVLSRATAPGERKASRIALYHHG